MWLLYELILSFALLCYLPAALWRRRLPHRGWSMRLGRYPGSVRRALASRRTIWVHAVSVGEVLACQPVLREFARTEPQMTLVVSTVTPTGFAVASLSTSPPRVPIYFPLDFSLCVRRALETVQPKMVVLVESELWPTMIRLTAARHIPIVLINGRMSARAFARSRWVAWGVRLLLQRIELYLMQSQADADRLIQLGAPPQRVRVVGNLKWEASVTSRASEEAIRATAAELGVLSDEPVLIAGSTHRGEEERVLHAFTVLRHTVPTLRLIIAPRHLERLSDVERAVARAGFAVRRCSREAHATRWDVGLVDTLGQLPRYYGISTVAIVGGSFIPHGGQNPLEPACLGKPVVFGPSMHNFAEIARQLLAHRAAIQVGHEAELAATLRELLMKPDEARAMGRRAADLTASYQGVTQRTGEALRPFLTAAASST